MNMQMTVKKAFLTGPFFLGRAPQRAESHVNDTGAAPLPFEAARRMFFYAAWPHDFGIGADGDLPKIKQSWPRKAGILGAPAFLEQTAPRITVGRTAG